MSGFRSLRSREFLLSVQKFFRLSGLKIYMELRTCVCVRTVVGGVRILRITHLVYIDEIIEPDRYIGNSASTFLIANEASGLVGRAQKARCLIRSVTLVVVPTDQVEEQQASAEGTRSRWISPRYAILSTRYHIVPKPLMIKPKKKQSPSRM